MPGIVHVLLGGGECQEGTTWEGLHLAARFKLTNLLVHIDDNGFQGSDPDLFNLVRLIDFTVLGRFLKVHHTRKGEGLKMFEDDPVKSVHLVSDDDYARFIKELA